TLPSECDFRRQVVRRGEATPDPRSRLCMPGYVSTPSMPPLPHRNECTPSRLKDNGRPCCSRGTPRPARSATLRVRQQRREFRQVAEQLVVKERPSPRKQEVEQALQLGLARRRIRTLECPDEAGRQ